MASVKFYNYETFKKSFARSISNGRFNGHLACFLGKEDAVLDYLDDLFSKEGWTDAQRKLALLRCMTDRAQKDETQIIDFFDDYDKLQEELRGMQDSDSADKACSVDDAFAQHAFGDPHKPAQK